MTIFRIFVQSQRVPVPFRSHFHGYDKHCSRLPPIAIARNEAMHVFHKAKHPQTILTKTKVIMNKSLIRLFCCLVLAAWGGMQVNADDDSEIVSLIVELNDDSRNVYELSDKPIVTFEGDSICVVSSVVSAKYLRTDVKDFHFGDATSTAIGLSSNARDIVLRYVDNENVKLTGDGLTTVVLYSAGGKMLARYHANGNSVNINLGSQAPGVYLIQVPSHTTYKVIKK